VTGFFVHGGRLADAAARHGGDPADWLDLSTGINPLPWPGQPAIDWRHLPDPTRLARLEAIAARHFGVHAAHCCAVPGSELALRQLAQVFDLPGHHMPPCYGGHVAAFPDSQPVHMPDDLPAGPSVTVIANPNNPDGRVMDQATCLGWLNATQARDGWLIVDEAFADSMAGTSVAHRVGDDTRLIVLRSFGKFFGLAGARLGFVIGPRTVMAALRRHLGDWPINAGALALGQGAYADTAWIMATRVDLAARAAKIDALFTRHGLSARGTCPLFRLIETDTAEPLFAALAQRHILTRPFAANPRWLRFGLADDAGLARLDRALTDIVQHG